ncbi:MAG: hypothetical protein ROO72_10290 [Marinobacter salarius]
MLAPLLVGAVPVGPLADIGPVVRRRVGNIQGLAGVLVDDVIELISLEGVG